MDADKIQKSTATDGQPPRPGYETAGAPAPIDPKTGQHLSYWVLSEEERAKGFTRPFRNRYRHLACGDVTSMGRALSETYQADPHYYGATFCCNCGKHFPLRDYRTDKLKATDGWAFLWMDGEPVGSTEEEAKAFKEWLERDKAAREIGGGI